MDKSNRERRKITNDPQAVRLIQCGRIYKKKKKTNNNMAAKMRRVKPNLPTAQHRRGRSHRLHGDSLVDGTLRSSRDHTAIPPCQRRNCYGTFPPCCAARANVPHLSEKSNT
uniref:60S ribosomal protein L29 n=1 Tax=Engystomops pustulosus TaxID=76066 RepID=A0AAV6YWT8_ENGPU|nr:hypothetical protein GDO81_029448 [Engystomops pustulosus]KAG8541273.1 hypothetical protein GDO81_029365 [Engystomops pustulosus]